MNKQQIIEKLKKLAALKERGMGGEAVNAERLFAELCSKYGIDPEQFGEEKDMEHAVVCVDQEHSKILSQIVWKRVGREGGRFRCIDPKIKIKVSERKILDEAYGVKGWNVLIKCTESQFVQVMFEWDILKQNYDKRKEAFMYAFLDTNGLILQAEGNEEIDRVRSEEHKKLAMEAARYSAFMEKAEVNKALEDSKAAI